MQQYPKTGIYLHIPFCVKKCGYCDFLSAPAKEDTQHRYVSALLKEIDLYRPKLEEFEISTIYIGGGTPSVLQPKEAERILTALKGLGVNNELCRKNPQKPFWEEATMEVNPGTIDKEKLDTYYACGIDRLSMGLQSTDNGELKKLGRIHTFEEFLENYDLARAAGFQNISIDLMSGLPDQTEKSWEQSLYKVAELNPDHISAYSLIIEEHTAFETLYGENGPLKDTLPSEEEERWMYKSTKRILQEKGFCRYEISNYAKKGKESKHNSSYWQRVDYVGMGVGASSCFGNERYQNTDDLQAYMQGMEQGEQRMLNREKRTRQSKMEEFMFLGLRMMEGISKKAFENEFSISMEEVYGSVIQKWISKGMLYECDGAKDRIALTDKGIDVSNWILSDFLI